MKNTNLFLLVATAALLFMGTSCEEKKPPPKPKEKAYYCFTSEDYKRLLPYTKGQVLKFINQDNKERTFTIQSVITDTVQLVYTSFLGVINLFRYDRKEIILIDGETGWFKIKFSRLPIEYDIAKQEASTEYPSKFYGAIQDMLFWNGSNEYGWFGDASIDYNQKKIEMTVNGKTYRDVFLIESGCDSIIEFRQSDQIYYRDVNMIYYDEIEGIIGFDDLNGNEWRLTK